jgi:ribonuclease P protein component
MLPSNKRFSRSEFSQFLTNKGIFVVFNRLGTLKYTIPSKITRFAVVTSSKNEKKAVSRNKLRRRVYSLVNSLSVPLQGVLYVSKQSYTLTYDEVKSLFNDLYTKAQKTTQ